MTTSTDSAAGRGLPASAAAKGIAMTGTGFSCGGNGMVIMPTPSGHTSLAPLRWRIEQEIERLISVLDAIDGDADLEQTATETRGAGFACDPSLEDAEALS